MSVQPGSLCMTECIDPSYRPPSEHGRDGRRRLRPLGSGAGLARRAPGRCPAQSLVGGYRPRPTEPSATTTDRHAHPGTGRRHQGSDRVASSATANSRHLCSRRVARHFPARTVVDLGRRLPLEAALITADAALRGGVVTRRQCEEMLRFQWTWPRIRRAMPVVRWATPDRESPLESFIRGRCIRLQLPVPEQQVTLGADFPLGRVDFYWRHARLIGEADGQGKYAGDPTVLWAEKHRQETLEDAGFSFIRWTWAKALVSDAAFAQRLLSALARAELVANALDAADWRPTATSRT